MQIKGKLMIKANNKLLNERQLQNKGMVQKFIDQECIRMMDPYTPRMNGVLTKSATLGTKIGSGVINYNAPYARYMYYGKLMVSSITGSSYALKGEKKILTTKELKYNGEPKRGAFWFERMKSDHKEKILAGAQKMADRGM
jgi:hypothetical protein